MFDPLVENGNGLYGDLHVLCPAGMGAGVTMPNYAIEASGVSYTYEEGTQALQGVDLWAEAGEFIAMLASNGSGKTTLLKVLVGLLNPREGRVLVAGQPLNGIRPAELYQQIGLVFQNPDDQLFAATVEEDVSFGPRNLGLPEADVSMRVSESLESVAASGLRSRAVMRELRDGWTTGACAAAAAKAATMVLAEQKESREVEITLPDGEVVSLPVLYARQEKEFAEAAVRKDAGDDPDVTNGVAVVARVVWCEGDELVIGGGEGVGVVTKPGLSIPPGEAAINPGPRNMIRTAVRDVTERGVRVVLSIPGGEVLAEKTFNQRLGIIGGLSILGTSGRVRPFSCPALRTSLKCLIDVAVACGVKAPVFVPGRIGERAAARLCLRLDRQQIVTVGNEWGFMLDAAGEATLEGLLILGHPGKLSKLAMGFWDTHSSRSPGAVSFVAELGRAVLNRQIGETTTVEGIFAVLTAGERENLGNALAEIIRQAVDDRLKGKFPSAVILVNIRGDYLGSNGDLGRWR